MMRLYKHTCNNVNNFTCLTENIFCPTLSHMTIGKRLKLARTRAGLTQAQLADALKGLMTQQNISLLESETTTGTEYIVQLAIACKVSPRWLAIGESEMVTEDMFYNNSPEAQLFKAMQNMDAATKYQLVKIGNSLIEPTNQSNGTDKK
jgi:transcriptional regulator with XRE-family HTH domain